MLHKGPQRPIRPIFPPPLMVKSVGSCPAADSAIPFALHWHYHHIPEALYTREQIIYGAFCQVLLSLISPSRACPVTAYIAECRCKLFWGSEVTVLILTSVWLRELALTMTLAFFWVSSWPSPSAAFSESRNRRLPRSNPITTTRAVCNKQLHYETAHSISTP
jgi:hypothetical protein